MNKSRVYHKNGSSYYKPHSTLWWVWILIRIKVNQIRHYLQKSHYGKYLIIPIVLILSMLVMVPATGLVCTSKLNKHQVNLQENISYQTTFINTSSLDKGTNQVNVKGNNGLANNTYEISEKCNKEISRTRVATSKITEPKTEELLVGTKYKEDEFESVPFASVTQEDKNLYYGQSRAVEGVMGNKRLTYEFSKDGDNPEVKKLISTQITVQPKNTVVYIGPRCSPHYTGCVPNTVSDVNCADIGYQVVKVIDYDPYNLDGGRGNGYGCDGYH